MYQLLHESANAVEVSLTKKITRDDLDRMSVDLNRLVTQHDKLRILCLMSAAEGWESIGSLVHDLKLDLRYNPAVERFAIVGGAKWQKWVTELMKPFAHGEIRYFEESSLEEARRWILT